MMCSDWDDVKPDILILGKALSGGTMPVSAVLANDEVSMLCAFSCTLLAHACITSLCLP